MKKLLVFLVVINFCPVVFGTYQQDDIIFYNGQQCKLIIGWSHSPFEIYYDIHKEKEYPFAPFHTANYRGHIATWEIKDGNFLLISVMKEHMTFDEDVVIPKKEDVALEELFGGKVKDGKVKAEWFKGYLLVDHDKGTPTPKESITFSLIEISGGEVVAEHNYYGDDFWILRSKYDNNEEIDQKQKAILDRYYRWLEGPRPSEVSGTEKEGVVSRKNMMFSLVVITISLGIFGFVMAGIIKGEPKEAGGSLNIKN